MNVGNFFYVHCTFQWPSWSFDFISPPLDSVNVKVTNEYRPGILMMLSGFPNVQTIPHVHSVWLGRRGISRLFWSSTSDLWDLSDYLVHQLMVSVFHSSLKALKCSFWLFFLFTPPVPTHSCRFGKIHTVWFDDFAQSHKSSLWQTAPCRLRTRCFSLTCSFLSERKPALNLFSVSCTLTYYLTLLVGSGRDCHFLFTG